MIMPGRRGVYFGGGGGLGGSDFSHDDVLWGGGGFGYPVFSFLLYSSVYPYITITISDLIYWDPCYLTVSRLFH